MVEVESVEGGQYVVEVNQLLNNYKFVEGGQYVVEVESALK